MRGTVLLLAAGSGDRLLARRPKAFIELRGVSLLRRAADGACAARATAGLVVAAPAGFESEAEDVLRGLSGSIRVVTGASTRQGSAAAALAAAVGAEAVAVHDAARALCSSELFDRSFDALDGAPAVCVAVPVSDTIKDVDGNDVRSTLDRSRLWSAQTPQAFHADVYRRAHEAAARDGVEATDDAALVERIGVPVRIVRGDPTNIKITTAADVTIAEALLDGGPMS